MGDVAIVDYGMGNLDSVARAVMVCGGTPRRLASPVGLAGCSRIILPGVGAFAAGMDQLRRRGWADALHEAVIGQGTPLLGICLGMQLLASVGQEGGETEGLGWIAGTVLSMQPGSPHERIPHVGWNEVHQRRPSSLLDGLPDGADMYFVHSFHLACADPADVAATCPYAGGVVAAVSRGPVMGVQFHPEKSQGLGLHVLRNYLDRAPC